MQNNYLKYVFLENFKFKPTENQDVAIDKLCNFILEKNNEKIFVLLGYAGTGKTSLMSAFVKTLEILKLRSVLLAPTGRAAKVFSNFSGKRALTIHKKIYRQKSASDYGAAFLPAPNLHSDTFFIVDEASMISNGGAEQAFFGSGRLLDDLIRYVYSGSNCRLILLGDTAQLPPVGSPESPALDVSELECYGLDVEQVVLNQVVRQAEESGILYNATKIRHMIENIESSQKTVLPKFDFYGFKDVERITGADLLEALEMSYDRAGLLNTLVITRSNKNANIYNSGIRNRIFWREEQICIGDVIMVVKNNYFYAKNLENVDFIANGDIAEITCIGRYETLYGFNFVNVDLRFADYDNLEFSAKVILDSILVQGAALSEADNNRLYQAVCADYVHLGNKRDIYKAVRENEYFNALQVKFAYAVTCHKSQGGQWDTVFIDQGYVTDDMLDREYLRWLYTAFTRATKKLYLVNFKDDFFE